MAGLNPIITTKEEFFEQFGSSFGYWSIVIQVGSYKIYQLGDGRFEVGGSLGINPFHGKKVSWVIRKVKELIDMEKNQKKMEKEKTKETQVLADVLKKVFPDVTEVKGGYYGYGNRGRRDKWIDTIHHKIDISGGVFNFNARLSKEGALLINNVRVSFANPPSSYFSEEVIKKIIKKLG